jgi:hypothetical protein
VAELEFFLEEPMSFIWLFYGLFLLYVLDYWPYYLGLSLFCVAMWWVYRHYNPKERKRDEEY